MISNDNDHDEWTKEVITILEKVRVNSINLSEYHRTRYYYFKGFSKYFDIPVLVLSTLSGSFSVGSQAYLPQSMISVIGCIISMLITIITSIKLYLNIQDNLQVELNMSKEFYTLAIDIYKVLTLPNYLKGEKGLSYLNKKYSLYNKLVEASDLLQKKNKHDQLATISIELTNDYSSINANTITNSDDNIELKNINKYDLPIIVNTPKNNSIIDPITTYNALNLDSPLFKNRINTKKLQLNNQVNNQLNNPLQNVNNQLNNPLQNVNNQLNNPLQNVNNQINDQLNNPLQNVNNQLNTQVDNQIDNQIKKLTATISESDSLDNIISLFDNKSTSKTKSKSKSKKR